MREWIMGSEGRMGVLTEAKVRVTRLPEREDFVGVFSPRGKRPRLQCANWLQAKLGLSMLRVSNAVETFTTLRMAGHARAIGWLERYLALRGVGEGKCLMMMGLTGSRAQVRAMRQPGFAIIGAHGGVSTGTVLGQKWAASASKRLPAQQLVGSRLCRRYHGNRLRLAPCHPHDGRHGRSRATGLARHGEKTHCYTHLSHVYAQGSSVYSTFVYRIGPDYDSALARWQSLGNLWAMRLQPTAAPSPTSTAWAKTTPPGSSEKGPPIRGHWRRDS